MFNLEQTNYEADVKYNLCVLSAAVNHMYSKVYAVRAQSSSLAFSHNRIWEIPN